MIKISRISNMECADVEIAEKLTGKEEIWLDNNCIIGDGSKGDWLLCIIDSLPDNAPKRLRELVETLRTEYSYARIN